MAEKKIRMTWCSYAKDGESHWVPMGRARTRCPRCGAWIVKKRYRDNLHVIVMREKGAE